MSDGREVVAALIEQLNQDYSKILEKLPASQGTGDELIEGFKTIQKKFFLKTQGGTDAATECTSLFNEVLDSINSGAETQEIQAKFDAFTGVAKNLIHTASTWVIRMT